MTKPIPTFDAKLGHCPMCGSQQINYFDHDNNDITIDRCEDCRLMFMNPQFSEDHLERYYASYITKEQREGFFDETKHAQKSAAFQLLKQFQPGGKLLAVGCGDGLEMQIARDLGYVVEGYDVDPATTDQVSQRLDLPVHSGSFSDLNIAPATFDCLFLDHVLEHPRNPADYLRQIHSLLKPGGMVYLGVPNLASFWARWKTRLGQLGLKNRRRGRHWDTEHHLTYFTPTSLKFLLSNKFGFEVLTTKGDPRVTLPAPHYRLARHYPNFCSRLVVIARRPASTLT